jgi:class 3 adenylate cyclase
MPGLLIVDDEEGVRRSLKKALGGEAYELFSARSGTEALEVVRGNPLDIVICDFKMPGMNGLETLVEIGKSNPDVTRIILTGYATLENAVDSLNSGIDGFLTKPFDNRELRQKVRDFHVRKKLRQFVSEQVLAEMQKSAEAMLPNSREATVLFIDIRRFTRISENLSPGELSRVLNHYFSPLDNIICEFNGTVDKHIGDGIMGVFGAPVSFGDDAQRAVGAALKIIGEISAINRSLESSAVELSVGIGIGTGEVMAGIFGSNRKKEYTVFGAAVNLAARLEGIAGENEILICAETFKKIEGRFTARKIEAPPLKGIERRIDIYSIFELPQKNS